MKKYMLLALMLPIMLLSCSKNSKEVDESGINGESGSRTYLPIGWYDDGSLEKSVKGLIGSMVSAGDYEGIKREIDEFSWDAANGIHVVNKSTLEMAVGAVSLNRPSCYYATQNYSGTDWSKKTYNYTCYFFYAYPYETAEYKIENDILYLKDTEDNWITYDTKVTVSGNVIKYSDREFKKVNYNGGYEWE